MNIYIAKGDDPAWCTHRDHAAAAVIELEENVLVCAPCLLTAVRLIACETMVHNYNAKRDTTNKP